VPVGGSKLRGGARWTSRTRPLSSCSWDSIFWRHSPPPVFGRAFGTGRKPRWQPPDRLFGPVWTVLYIANAVAGWLVWQRDGLGTPILVYLLSLAFNAGWSAIFFGLRRIDWALFWILGLCLSVVAVIAAFVPVSTTAAVLLLPYLAWVAFAAALNGSIWRLNGGRPAEGRQTSGTSPRPEPARQRTSRFRVSTPAEKAIAK